jgi:hypothetical protein
MTPNYHEHATNDAAAADRCDHVICPQRYRSP